MTKRATDTAGRNYFSSDTFRPNIGCAGLNVLPLFQNRALGRVYSVNALLPLAAYSVSCRL
jgi:hypothetical protein